MSDRPVHYGQFQSERLAEESQAARDIVKVINNYGISERQRWLVMYFLSLELENIEDLKAMSAFIKARKSAEIFLSGNEEKEINDGSISK